MSLVLKRSLAAVAGAVMFLGLSPTGAFADAEYQLTYAEIASERGPRAEAIKWWADEVNKRTDGRVEIDVVWGGGLLKSKDQLKGVGSGIADIGTLVSVLHPAEQVLWTFGGQPLNEADPWVAMRAWYDLRGENEQFAAELTDNNLHILAHNSTGATQLVCKDDALDTAEEIRGRKINATGGFIKFFEEMGANVISITGTELYPAIERGIVDCFTYYVALTKSYKFYEVADHVILADLGQSNTYGVVMNLDTWNSLPEDIQAVFNELGIEYMNRYARNMIEQTVSAQKEMEAGIDGQSMTFHELNPEEREKWRQFTGTFVPDWKEKTGLPEEQADTFIAQLDALTAKYRQIRDEQGYPWERN